MVASTNYDVDEAFDDDDLCVDGEADMKQSNDSVLIEGRSFCPSTDVIIVIENSGKHIMLCDHVACYYIRRPAYKSKQVKWTSVIKHVIFIAAWSRMPTKNY